MEGATSVTNTQMRRWATVFLVVALAMSIADGTAYFDANETIFFALLGQATALYGLPTWRNVQEAKYDAKKV